jgi:glycerol uptake facilitator-like aquaporin
MKFHLARRVCAEFLGTAFLLTAVVGSGIMGERLSDGNAAIALLVNSIATGAALVTLIFAFGGISGAHFNPVATLADSLSGGIARSDIFPYCLAGASRRRLGNHQFAFHVWPADDHTVASRAKRPRTILCGIIATFGLLSVISGGSRLRPAAIPLTVGTYIAGAYGFTSSTSFANPAVTAARCITDTFAGIRPRDVPGFVLAQFLGGTAAFLVFRWMVPSRISAESGACR